MNYGDEKVQVVDEQPLKLADEMTKAIIEFNPTQQNQVINGIISNIKGYRDTEMRNRDDDIEVKRKEIELMRELNKDLTCKSQ
jgi:hypothetical protein